MPVVSKLPSTSILIHNTAVSEPEPNLQNFTIVRVIADRVMAKSTINVLSRGFLPLGLVTIGRLVTSALEPGQDYWPNKSIVESGEVETRSISDFHSLGQSERKAEVTARATKFLMASSDANSNDFVKVESQEVTQHWLKNQTSYLERLCTDNATKQWLEKMQKRYPIFLVVGLITIKNAKATIKAHSDSESRCGATIPVGDLVSHGTTTILPIASDSLDVSAKVSVGNKTTTNSSGLVVGEMVIGVQYRKLRFRIFSSRKADSAYLENKKTQWILFEGSVRGGAGDSLGVDFEDANGDVDSLELGEDAKGVEAIDNFIFVTDSTF